MHLYRVKMRLKIVLPGPGWIYNGWKWDRRSFYRPVHTFISSENEIVYRFNRPWMHLYRVKMRSTIFFTVPWMHLYWVKTGWTIVIPAGEWSYNEWKWDRRLFYRPMDAFILSENGMNDHSICQWMNLYRVKMRSTIVLAGAGCIYIEWKWYRRLFYGPMDAFILSANGFNDRSTFRCMNL